MANFVIFRCVYLLIFFKTAFQLYYCIKVVTKFHRKTTTLNHLYFLR